MAPHTAITDDLGFDHTLSDDSTPSDDLAQLSRSPVAALWAVQRSSSAMYQVATPYLYRYLRITHRELIRLLWTFEDITRIDEVINQDPENDSHPLDYHLYHRLQWALSSVKELHLTVYSRHDLGGNLTIYTEISTALKILGRPPLWSALDKVSVRVRSMYGAETADPDSYACFPYESEIMRAVGPTLHPTFLAIELPDPSPHRHFKANPTDVESSLWSMCADHVTVSNFSEFSQGVPKARLSFTIGFSARYGKLTRGSSSNSSQALFERGLLSEYYLPSVSSLTLIGIDRGLKGLPSSHIRSELGRHLYMSVCSYRGRDGQSLYRIRPWNSPDHGDWDVWYSYDETLR